MLRASRPHAFLSRLVLNISGSLEFWFASTSIYSPVFHCGNCTPCDTPPHCIRHFIHQTPTESFMGPSATGSEKSAGGHRAEVFGMSLDVPRNYRKAEAHSSSHVHCPHIQLSLHACASRVEPRRTIWMLYLTRLLDVNGFCRLREVPNCLQSHLENERKTKILVSSLLNGGDNLGN